MITAREGQLVRWFHPATLAVGTVACLSLTPAARADFSLSYKSTAASLTLFNQPQPSPFAGVAARLFVKGERLRLEVKDHWGRQHVWISDRSRGKTLRLYEDRRYEQFAGGWSCENIPVQLALLLAESLNAGGIDSLTISGGESGTWKTAPSKRTHWTFLARVFGLPNPVRILATVHFPAQEAVHFGAESAELYCGARPGESAWKSAFEKYLSLSPDGCRTLAQAVGLPLALDFTTDLGSMGTAKLLLEATEHSNQSLDGALFSIPEGFTSVKPAE